MRMIFALLVTVAAVTPAWANHIAGHYGGVPMVQPAPLPWQQPQPASGYRGYVAPPPPQPQYVLPPPRPIYVVPPPLGPSDAPRRGPNVCETINC